MSASEAVNPPRPAAGSRRARTIVWVTALFVVALVSFISHEWDAAVHSIIGLAAAGAVAWHVYTQRRWIRSAITRRSRHPEVKLLYLNGVLATVFVAVIVSGIPVWVADTGGAVASIHQVTGILFLPLVIAHLILNRRRLAAALGRTARRRHQH